MTPRPRPRRILVIDDDPDALELLRSLLLDSIVEIDEAADGATGLTRARHRVPDLIVLDMVLPDTTGTELLQQLRAETRLHSVPVMIVSARRDQATKIAAFEAGADDYVLKPYDLEEILARIRAQLGRRELYERLERLNVELRLANARLEELAITDELTGLANARHFRARLDEEFLRAERYETSLALVIADLDGFKKINDSYGHHAGDKLLAQLAQRLAAQARATDISCRYGGDEFAFLLPHTGLEEAAGFAERICERTAAAPLRLPTKEIVAMALSCGVASWPECAAIRTANELFLAADQALYGAKQAGKGIVAAAPLAESGNHGLVSEPSPRKRRLLRGGKENPS